jgi:Leucine-rich repeat (LRR) protein
MQSLTKLKKLSLSFNKLTSLPSLSEPNGTSLIEYLDVSFNNIETIDAEST